MGYPTLEEIGIEVVRVLQERLAPHADVYGLGQKTAIEVAGPDGNPVLEVQDRPKLAVFGPLLEEIQQRRKPYGMRVLVDKDAQTLTYRDAPIPAYYDIPFQLVGYAVRESSIPGGAKGILWLQHEVTVFLRGGKLMGAGWRGDEPGFDGYYYEVLQAPERIPGDAADLHAFSARMRLRDVALGPDDVREGPLVGALDVSLGVARTG